MVIVNKNITPEEETKIEELSNLLEAKNYY